VIGAYKATLIEALEIEIYTPPLDLYVEEAVARITARLYTTRTRNAVET